MKKFNRAVFGQYLKGTSPFVKSLRTGKFRELLTPISASSNPEDFRWSPEIPEQDGNLTRPDTPEALAKQFLEEAEFGAQQSSELPPLMANVDSKIDEDMHLQATSESITMFEDASGAATTMPVCHVGLTHSTEQPQIMWARGLQM